MYDATGDMTLLHRGQTDLGRVCKTPLRIERIRLAAVENDRPGGKHLYERPRRHRIRHAGQLRQEAGNIDEYNRYLEESQTCFDQNIHVMNNDGTLDNPP